MRGRDSLGFRQRICIDSRLVRDEINWGRSDLLYVGRFHGLMRQHQEDRGCYSKRRECTGEDLGEAWRARWLRLLGQVRFETLQRCGRDWRVHLPMEICVDRSDERALLRPCGGPARARLLVLADRGREFVAGYGGFDQRGFVFFT